MNDYWFASARADFLAFRTVLISTTFRPRLATKQHRRSDSTGVRHASPRASTQSARYMRMPEANKHFHITFKMPVAFGHADFL
jgi:hypothetical protein